MEINRFFGDSPQVAEQVMPFKLSIGDDGRAITFALFTMFNEGEVGVAVSTASVHRIGQTVLSAPHRPGRRHGLPVRRGAAPRRRPGSRGPRRAAGPEDRQRRRPRPAGRRPHPARVHRRRRGPGVAARLPRARPDAGRRLGRSAGHGRARPALGDGDADGSMPLHVVTNPLQITCRRPGTVHVGRRFGLPFTVAVPPQAGAGGGVPPGRGIRTSSRAPTSRRSSAIRSRPPSRCSSSSRGARSSTAGAMPSLRQCRSA